ncbi:MAG: zinc ABC transporter substrate-binding protein [candidate division Zixibacteria bacterium]|nr:zinc ABC transporter substrate-binding protein [candidate division Zixibacteria bacterium]MBU1470666.1 zinc ABC transporter substrate-binding protein [candidate division Zixibacteria bacterium]MBU2626692.1 zinc ABC transporter substrate-binding protein [candidate division Zixibacteria bacterium]
MDNDGMNSVLSRAIVTSLIVLVILTVCALIVEPAAYADEPSDGAVRVVTSILPQAYFVDKIGGATVEVNVLVGPGQSPETYEPTPKQMVHLSRSDILFTVGLPFERALIGKITEMMPHLRIVETQANTPKELRSQIGSHSYHDFDDPHDHGDLDPHIWLDPSLVKIQSRSICDALVEAMPDKREFLEANYDAFVKELDSVDAEVSRILESVRGRELFVFHPAFGHFARAYGLKQIAIEQDGKEPGAGELAKLVERAETDGVSVIFVQQQFSTAAASAVAEAIGAKVVTLDPLARDYSANMIKMAMIIAKSLSGR